MSRQKEPSDETGFADQLEQASCPTFRALRERDPALVTEVSDKAEVAQ